LARVLCTKNNISGKCAIVIFQFFFSRRLWLGLVSYSLLCLQVFLPTTG
jgi:hypothetical protein